MNFENIASTFSTKSDLILAEIMKRYNLGEPGDLAELVLTKLTMSFSREEVSKKEVASFVQKELNLPQQTAEQITEELINKIIPTLWNKMPKKEGGEEILPKTQPLSGIKKSINVSKALNKKINKPTPPPVKKRKIIKKKSVLPQNPQKKSNKKDSYREPIE